MGETARLQRLAAYMSAMAKAAAESAAPDPKAAGPEAGRSFIYPLYRFRMFSRSLHGRFECLQKQLWMVLAAVSWFRV